MFLGYIDPGTGYTIAGLGAWLISLLAGFLGLSLVFLKKIFRFIKKSKKNIWIATALILLLAAGTLEIFMFKKENTFQQKIIVLGFDGLSPDIIEEMIKEGALPHFQILKENGSYRRLATTNPPQSPVAWAAFATGQNPGKNDIYDFIIRNPRTYALDLSLSCIKNERAVKTVKAKEFWQYTKEAKIPTIVIGCPLTFPPDKIYGRMLSGMGVPDILGTEGTFTFYTSASEPEKKDTGGKIFYIPKSKTMTLHLIGPKTPFSFDAVKNIQVPFTVSLNENTAILTCQHRTIKLKTGAWSPWQEVIFDITPFKKMKGIYKFYLITTEPEFKLYISPIQFDPRDPYFPISTPKNYSRELAQNIGLFHTQGMPVDTWAINEGRLNDDQLSDMCDETFNERKSMLDFEMNRFKNGLLFCYFGTSDTVQHMFWRANNPAAPQAPEKYKDIIRTYYKKMDAILGACMKKIDPEKDTLIVLSDHGFSAFNRTVHINTWLKNNGYLALKTPDTGEENALLENIDWAHTQAYAIGFGSIYINQKDREKNGIIAPGPETKKLKNEISRKLKDWRDGTSDNLIIHNVYANEEIFKGKYAKDAPDLVVGFNTGYRASWQTALGAVPQVLIEDNVKKWSGDHLFDPSLVPGVLFSNKKITKTNPSLYDILPTLLKIMRIKNKTSDLDGGSLF